MYFHLTYDKVCTMSLYVNIAYYPQLFAIIATFLVYIEYTYCFVIPNVIAI